MPIMSIDRKTRVAFGVSQRVRRVALTAGLVTAAALGGVAAPAIANAAAAAAYPCNEVIKDNGRRLWAFNNCSDFGVLLHLRESDGRPRTFCMQPRWERTFTFVNYQDVSTRREWC